MDLNNSPLSSATMATHNHAVTCPSSTDRNIALLGSLFQHQSATKEGKENETDSGYSSTEVSRQTPKSSTSDTTTATTATDMTSKQSSHLIHEAGHVLRVSKSKTVLAFNCKMEHEYLERFYAIQRSVETLLLQSIKRKSWRKRSMPPQPMAIRPMLVGSTAVDARPHIVVLCAPEMRKKIQHFLDTDELIQGFYKPTDPLLPKFNVLACGCAPRLRIGSGVRSPQIAAIEDNDLDSGDYNFHSITPKIMEYDGSRYQGATVVSAIHFSATAHDSQEDLDFGPKASPLLYPPYYRKDEDDCGTYCGRAIRFKVNERRKNATLGGLILLKYPNRTTKLKGLTAGHAAMGLIEEVSQGEESDGSSINSEDSSRYEASDSGQLPGDTEHHRLGPWSSAKTYDCKDVILPSPFDIGVEQTDDDSQEFFDWALLDSALLDLDDYRVNKLPFGGPFDWSIIEKYREEPAADELSEEEVILLCPSSGSANGRVLPQPASILISPGDVFVDAYLVTLDDGARFSDGDSGTWIVSKNTRELLGHIVATDQHDGSGYIMRACDVFRDIARRTGAIHAGLPSEADVYAWYIQSPVRTELLAKETQGGSGSSAPHGDDATAAEDGAELSASREVSGQASGSSRQIVAPSSPSHQSRSLQRLESQDERKVDAPEIIGDMFYCPYPTCRNFRDPPAYRQEAFLDHLRYFHHELIGYSDRPSHRKSRYDQNAMWRCPNCLGRFAHGDGHECEWEGSSRQARSEVDRERDGSRKRHRDDDDENDEDSHQDIQNKRVGKSRIGHGERVRSFR